MQTGNTEFSEEFRQKFEDIRIRSHLDVPYSQGVISIFYPIVDTFSENGVDELKQVAEILLIGLTRLSDLEALKKQTVDLAEFDTKFRSLIETLPM